MQHLRLTHPDLDSWIDVRLREFEGRWLAVADLADEPDVGTSEDPREALRRALMALGPRLAQELAASAALDRPPGAGAVITMWFIDDDDLGYLAWPLTLAWHTLATGMETTCPWTWRSHVRRSGSKVSL